MEATGNPSVKFMHCLSAPHNRETEINEAIFEKRHLVRLNLVNCLHPADSWLVQRTELKGSAGTLVCFLPRARDASRVNRLQDCIKDRS
jgi:hypothetical protein